MPNYQSIPTHSRETLLSIFTMDTESPDSQALPQGTLLHEFVVERVLGSGGFGITYLARDTSLGRQVVIKENLPSQFAWRETTTGTVRPRHSTGGDLADYEWSMNNFLREAETLASLDHPCICRVLRKFEMNGTAYFVMPFVEGVTLDKLIADWKTTNRLFTEEELSGLLENMLGALGYIHDRGIYHRDIKPGNILITNEGIPVLIDFGSARQRLSERSMTVIESAGYTPFEQLQSKGNVGPWSDLYALAATLVKTITSETPPKAADRVMDDPWPGLVTNSGVSAHYSTRFLRSIEKALAPLPKDRWQNAGEWKVALATDPLAVPPPIPVAPPVLRPPESQSPTPDEGLSLEFADSEQAIELPEERIPKKPKLSKSTRQSLIATVCCLLALGLIFLIIKNSGKSTSTAQTVTPNAETNTLTAAEVHPSEWRKMAEAGDPLAQALLGRALYRGGMKSKGIEKNEQEGGKWIQASADAGHPLGLFFRGLLRPPSEKEIADKEFAKAKELGLLRNAEKGGPIWWTAAGLYLEETSKDPEKLKEAVKWYRLAAEAGYPVGMNNLGLCYADGIGVIKNDEQTAKWFRAAAESGDDQGMSNLGLCYEHGIGVTKDEREAVKWYRGGADAGDTLGMFNLGVCYANGTGVTKDEREAVKWYRAAADAGETNGMVNLGFSYANGTGVTKDEGVAVKWYRAAADAGNAQGMFNLGLNYDNGIGVTKDEREAVKWYRSAAEAGDAQSMVYLGINYANGIGVTKDEREAVKWYRAAADAGDTLGMFNLGVCYAKGTGVTKDEREAVKWFRAVAEGGDAKGMFNLGICYANGTGVTKDEREAVKWYRKAAGQGHAGALVNLGVCYSNGDGVPKDLVSAYMWTYLAAPSGEELAKKNLELFATSMSGDEVAEAVRMAEEWKAKHQDSFAK